MLQIEPWTAVDTGDLPVGDVERFLLGDEVVEIPDAVLEEVGTGTISRSPS